MFAPIVSADTTSYTAGDIETWLEDAISGAEVTVTVSPSVTLDATNHRMIVQDFAFAVRGVTVGLEDLRLKFDDTKIVQVEGSLAVLGKYPKFSCDLELEYLEGDGELQVADISNIVIATTFTPTLSPGDIATIVDVMNQILDAAGGLPVTPDGALEGVNVDGTGLVVRWTNSNSSYSSGQIQDKLDGMVNTLATKATAYLQAREVDWNIDVEVAPYTSLDIDASFTAFGITVALSGFNVIFDTLTATVTDATVSVGGKTFTFSAEGEISCSGGDPSIAMASLTLGDEYPGLQSFVADVEAALLDAIDQAVDAIVTSTGLAWTFCPSSIAVVDTNVVLTSSGTASVKIDLQVGWNMVSVPVIPDDASAEAVFPDGDTVYTWNPVNKTYVQVLRQ
jgi:hypothetical protein